MLNDAGLCNICMDFLSASGDHRVVALKCGHFYGDLCVRKWVKENKNCPQCKCSANTRDFRNIFATKIVVVDSSREKELDLKINQLTREASEAAAMNNQNMMTIALQRRQIRELETEIQKLKALVVSNRNSTTTCIQIIKGAKMYLEKNVDFKEGAECKLISYMPRSKKILITQKSSGNSLFNGYGVRFMDAVHHKCEKFINMGNKPICDFSFDPTETYVMCTSKEATVKVFNISTCQSVATFSPSQFPIWSCAFNKSRDNQVIFGTQNGIVYIYDLKKANEVLHTIENSEKSPVKFIVPIARNDSFPNGGFFVVQVRGLYFYEYSSGYGLAQTKLNFEDSVFTATYDEKTEMLLITTAGMDQTFHILTRLVKIDNLPVLQEIYRIPSNQATVGIPKFTRPTQIKVPDGFIVACYKDETKELEIHTPSVGKMHSFVMQNPVSDICPIYEASSVSFAALASTKCRIYKVNLEYR